MRQVLTGPIARSNDTLSLTLRHYRRRSDQPLWTASFSGKTNEFIALEERALRQLTTRLGLRTSPSESQRIDTLLTNNLAAFRWYQQAQAVHARTAGTQSGYKETRKFAHEATKRWTRPNQVFFWSAGRRPVQASRLRQPLSQAGLEDFPAGTQSSDGRLVAP